MKKFITTSMAALTLAGTGLAAAPASAHDWGGYGYRHHSDDAGYAIAGGIIGLALGAALASHHNHYDRYHNGYGYNGYGYSGYNNYNRDNGYNNYNNYNGYNGYNSYGYSQPQYGSSYGYGTGYDRDGD
jgi:hypothetical protein